MKKVILILLAAVMSLSMMLPCNMDGRYHIEGTIDNSDGYRAILMISDRYGEIIGSDTSLIKEGIFFFEGEEYLERMSNIIVEDKFGQKMEKYPNCSIMLEKGTISVSYPNGKHYRGGTPLNDLYMEYCDSLSYLESKVKFPPNWISQGGIYIGRGSETERALYEQGEYMIRFIKNNFNNPVGKALFMSDISFYKYGLILPKNVYLHKNAENGKSFEEIFSFVDADIRNDLKVKEYMDNQTKRYTLPSYVGRKIDDFQLSTPVGNSVKLSDYIGNKEFTFVEFWASWCGPCIAAIAELKDMYNKYQDKLEIVSVSLDTSNESWKNAMKEHNMQWTQLGDMKGFDSEIAKTFKIKGIPLGLLLDKNGVIIENYNTSPIWLKFFMEHQ